MAIKELRVALLAPVWGRRGGWSRVVEKMTPLIAEKVETTLFVPVNSTRMGGSFNFGVKYVLPPLSFHPLHPRVVKYTLRFLHDLRQGKYDLIQTYDSWPLSFLGGLGSRLFDVPLFVGAHGTAAIKPLFNMKTRQSLVWSYKIARAIFCISSFTKNMLERITGLSKFHILPLDGVDYEFFAKQRDISDLECKWGHGNIILTVAKLKERKGIDVSLKAFKYVKQAIYDAKYLIVGGGDPSPYKKLANELALRDVFFIGQVSDEELAKYYHLCDVFVMTPKRFGQDVEGFGLVYLEAGAAGKPVVASRHGGVADVVKHMKNGLIVPENDHESTAKAILTLLLDRRLSEKLGRGGREVAIQYRWNNAVDNLIRSWREMLQSGGENG
ncbi:GDP-mannose-dependent alpha-(1-6)-phosphatidylinositol monomannoside mannosyltransferase [Candidatus Calditenuaceae archaeon HR02]|nr:GDP-mannose-dependent alpha-(1-6)-phosphatidylinositol monomannoside mannosyltransferase [Candidatus Calditenuaceae archaeon HR02]